MTESIPPDPRKILASLGISEAQAERVTGGAATAVWKVIWRGQSYALRVFRSDQTAACEHEITFMRIAAASGISVPEIIRQGVWMDQPVLLLSWIRGATLIEQLRAQPWNGWRLGTAFGRMQAEIHRVSIPEAHDSTGWIEWAGDEPELKARLYDLKSRTSRLPQSSLLHLDYHPLNVMAEGQNVTGVLDWTNAAAGDPRADFARTYTILRVEPLPPSEPALMTALLRRVLERAWRSGYQQAGGHLGHPNEMALFYAWAGAVMIRDLGRHLPNPDHWLEDHHFDSVRRWRDHWKQQAGIPL